MSASRLVVVAGLLGLLAMPVWAADDSPALLVVSVVDAAGKPVSRALVSVDGLPAGRTDDQGHFVLDGRAPGEVLTVGVRGPKGQGTTVRPIRLVDGEQEHVLALDVSLATSPEAPEPTPAEAAVLTVLAVDEAGVPLERGTVVVDGLVVGKTGADGALEFSGRAAGTTVVVAVSSADGTRHGVGTVELSGGPQRVQLVAEAQPEAPAPTQVAASPAPAPPPPAPVVPQKATLAIWVVDKDGKAVEGATVLLDGEEAGRTAADGSFVLEDQRPGRRLTAAVRAEHRRPAELEPLTLTEGRVATTVALEPIDTDGDGIVDRDDACLDEPERRNGYRDEDGCVDALASVAVRVTSTSGDPLAGVEVRLDGTPAGRTDDTGRLLVTDRMPGTEVEVSVVPPDDTWMPVDPRAVALAEGPQSVSLALEEAPVPVAEVEVAVPAAVVAATAAVVALPEPEPEPAPPLDPDEDGLAGDADACPDVAEVANGYQDDDGCPDALATVRLAVKDGSGAPLAGATVRAAGREVGRTDAGGSLQVADLVPDETATLEVALQGYEGAEIEEAWASGEQVREIALVASDTDGDTIADLYDACPHEAEVVNGWHEEDGCPDALATVRFTVTGAEDLPLPDAVIARDGELVGVTDKLGRLVLTGVLPGQVGAYTVSVPSTDYGSVEVPGELAEGEQERQVALVRGDFDVDGVPDGDDACPEIPESANGWKDTDGCPDRLSAVFLTVTDPQGSPLEGAVVREGDVLLGRTDAAGELHLDERLPGGTVTFSASLPGTDREQADLSVQLLEGAQTLSLALGRHDQDADGFADDDDGCPEQAEAANGYADDDGCPDTLATVLLTLTDDVGAPAPGVTVSSEAGAHGRTLTDGTLRVEGLVPGSVVTFSAEKSGTDLVPASFAPITLEEGEQAAALALARRDTDGDGLADSRDGCPGQVETLNGYADDDGCPDALATLSIEVRSSAGGPLADAVVEVDGQAAGRTDAEGRLVLADLVPGRTLDVAVKNPSDRFEPGTLSGVTIAEGVNTRRVTLTWLAPADADADGLADDSDACPDQPETVNGHADDDGCPDALGGFEVVLSRPDGAPLVGAVVAIDGVEQGRTGPDGILAVDALIPGKPVVLGASVPGADYLSVEDTLTPSEGVRRHAVAMSRIDTDGDGLYDADDACPRRAETVNDHEDDDGCPDVVPAPVVAAPVLAAAASAAVPEPEPEPEPPPPPPDPDGDGLAGDADACPDEPETVNGHADDDGCPDSLASLRVEVVTAHGEPLAGAEVALDGEPAGRTDASGNLVIADLLPTRTVEVGVQPGGDAWLPVEPEAVKLGEGANSRRVRVQAAPPRDGDEDGLVDAEDACPAEAETVNAYRDDDGCPDQLGTLQLQVTDEEGQAVDGAAISVDGAPVGRSDGRGWLRVDDLVPGREVAVAVMDSRFEPLARTLAMTEGSQELVVALRRPPEPEPEPAPVAPAPAPEPVAVVAGPPALAVVRIEVTGPDHYPVVGAEVRIDGETVGVTDDRGVFVLVDRVPGTPLVADVVPPPELGLLSHTIAERALAEGEQVQEVELPGQPAGVRVLAKAPNGVPLPGMVVLFGDVSSYEGEGRRVIDVRTGELVAEIPMPPGGLVLQLPPGSWRVVVMARGFVSEERSFDVTLARDLVNLEVPLTPRRQPPAQPLR